MQTQKDQPNLIMGDIEKRNSEQRSRILHPTDIPPGIVKEWHTESNTYLVRFGILANRPDGSTHTKMYYATDNNILYAWNGSAWVQVNT